MDDRTFGNVENFTYRDSKKGEVTELGVFLEKIICIPAYKNRASFGLRSSYRPIDRAEQTGPRSFRFIFGEYVEKTRHLVTSLRQQSSGHETIASVVAFATKNDHCLTSLAQLRAEVCHFGAGVFHELKSRNTEVVNGRPIAFRHLTIGQ